MSRLQIRTKEEYTDLIHELRENCNICLKTIFDYKKLLEVMPCAYAGNVLEDYRYYQDTLKQIKPEELLKDQYRLFINIRNKFDSEYPPIKSDIEELHKINAKYLNCLSKERTDEISRRFYGSNINQSNV